MKTVVIGSGSWGSALAQVLQDKEEEDPLADCTEIAFINSQY